MSNENENIDIDELESHYDFDYSQAKPNRFATDLFKQEGVVVLSKQLRDFFPNSESVNNALMDYIKNHTPESLNKIYSNRS